LKKNRGQNQLGKFRREGAFRGKKYSREGGGLYRKRHPSVSQRGRLAGGLKIIPNEKIGRGDSLGTEMGK